MLAAVWIFVFIGLGLWSLASWGLYVLLSIDPQWLDDVQALVLQVPYSDKLERWFPGWERMMATAVDLAQSALGWVGSNAPLVAWIVWSIGTIALLAVGGLLTLLVSAVQEKKSKAPATRQPA